MKAYISGSRLYAWMPWTSWMTIEGDEYATQLFIDSLKRDLGPDYRLSSETPTHYGKDPDPLGMPRGQAVWIAEPV